MIIDRISQARFSLTQWGKDCVRIDNQMPLTQENYDPKGFLIGKVTLAPGYHNYCKQPAYSESSLLLHHAFVTTRRVDNPDIRIQLDHGRCMHSRCPLALHECDDLIDAIVGLIFAKDL
jgi:hypothetical protein